MSTAGTSSQHVKGYGRAVLCALCLLLVSNSPARAAGRTERARYYVAVRETKESTAKPCGLKKVGHELLLARLKQTPGVVTKISAKPLRGAELERELRARKLEAYALVLRITKCEHALNPPRPGGSFKMLVVEVAVGLDAEKIPSGQIARAGEGTAQVGTEVRRLEQRELEKLRLEALEEAIGQAVDKFVKSLAERKAAKRRRRSKRPRAK